ncbi:DUF58 domain-containing protein [Haloplanus sp.]|uniref:DUF58 domain-containing protein n=1 Tax=Haloplanus sp. TaxID=1961696 RepID=UPI002623B344|nr:DUF58 domain-containing protein [Haloplanus sp.]
MTRLRDLRHAVGGGDPVGSVDRADDNGDGDSQTPAVRPTGRWRGVVGVVFLAVAVGILAKRPAVLLMAAVGVVFAVYPLVTTVPDPTLSVDRRIDPESPADGDAVAVRTTIRNEGDVPLFDLRIVDGPPPTLSVAGGSPRGGATIGPGESVTLTYDLRARPGRHRFGPTTLLCRDASGAVEVERRIDAPDRIDCSATLPTVPLRGRSGHRTGPLVTDDGGSGLEFHSVTEYERGDPANRIDWRRFARTGELNSVTFRTERLADVVVCIDARPDAYRARSDDDPHAVAHAVDAAGRIGDALLDANHRAGLAAFGRESFLLAPGSGDDHAHRFHRRLATAPALTPSPPESVGATRAVADESTPRSDPAAPLDHQLSAIRERLGSTCQVVLLTPLCDGDALDVARRFESDNAHVTVVSPDVTSADTPGGRLARLERDSRLAALRNANIPAADCDPATPLGSALEHVERSRR